jgi:hypothetical protein
MVSKQDDILGTGLAGYAMMLSLLSSMTKAGQGEEAMAILEGARKWLLSRNGANSTRMVEARGRIEEIEKNLGLLNMKTEGAVQ